MKENVNFSDFCDRFQNYERDDNFSYEGKRALFNYLEQYEEDTGEEIELDVIALCCEYTEYKNLEELQNIYSRINSMEELEEHTTVIIFNDLSDGFIIQNF
jgi:hypothetical protein